MCEQPTKLHSLLPLNFFPHRGFTNTYHHTSLLQLEGVKDKEASSFYFGKKVAYIYKVIHTYTNTHTYTHIHTHTHTHTH
jgi:ribosomal protein L35AE/L33A